MVLVSIATFHIHDNCVGVIFFMYQVKLYKDINLCRNRVNNKKWECTNYFSLFVSFCFCINNFFLFVWLSWVSASEATISILTNYFSCLGTVTKQMKYSSFTVSSSKNDGYSEVSFLSKKKKTYRAGVYGELSFLCRDMGGAGVGWQEEETSEARASEGDMEWKHMSSG